MSGTPSPIFRQAALDRLSNPEQLDRIMTVARPSDWLALAGLLTIVLAVIGWSILGTVATRVSGSGILVAQGGAIFTPVANGDGLVVQMTVTPGQHVVAGERLARIAQPDLEQQLASAAALLAEDEAQLGSLRDQVGNFAAARAQTRTAQHRLLEQQRADAVAKAADLDQQLQSGETLLTRGIVTRAKVSELRQQVAGARQTVGEANSRLIQIEADEINSRNGDARDVRASQSKLGEARRRVRELAADLDRKQWVRSPAAGRVVEVKAPLGSRVNVGMPVFAIENGSAALQLILYVPPRDGKLVRPGMAVNIAPSVARKEEVGTMLGHVVAVSDFPATLQAMQSTLQNDQLVKDFSTGGAPIVATIVLDRAPRTATGYAWAGGSGPQVPLTSGTIAEAEVTVSRQAPITFALPFLRGFDRRVSVPGGTSAEATVKVRRAKVPEVLQLEAVECGAASLVMVLAHFGRWVTLEQARIDCGVSRDGSKASNILIAARRYGMVAKGYRKEVEALASLPTPLIIHWNFNHFLVLEGMDGDRVFLTDPASGSRVVNMEEFSEAYTGVAISLRPGDDFMRGGDRPKPIRAIARRLAGTEGSLMLIGILAVTLVVPAVAIPAFAKMFVDGVLVGNQAAWLRPLILGMVLTALLRAALVIVQQRLLIRIQNRISVTGAARFIWHMLRLPIPFFSQRHPGDIATRVAATDRLAAILSGDLSQAMLDLATTSLLGLVMLAYDPLLGCIAVAALAPNFLLLKLVGERQKRFSQRQGAEESKLHSASVGAIETIETLKASGLEAQAFERWAGYQAKLLGVRRELAVAEIWITTAPIVMRALATVLILAVGAARILGGAMSVGTLVAFLTLAEGFAEPIGRFVGLAGRLREAAVDVGRIDDAFDTPVDPQVDRIAEGPLPVVRGEVELRNVTFGYSRLEPPLIEDFSLHLQPGMRVALVGGSGSGKSTIARLLGGLAAPWAGEVLIDGRPLDSMSSADRTRTMATVDQDVFLFEGSVRDNLTLWDGSVDDRRLVAALSDAALLEEIVSRPGSLDSPIAEGGVNFSGGQRQRLEIARALVADPAVLILDEATAALDATTEKQIDERLRARGATCVIVAHRLSTVRDADEIIVMRRGRIVERGTHDALIDRDGEYAALIATH